MQTFDLVVTVENGGLLYEFGPASPFDVVFDLASLLSFSLTLSDGIPQTMFFQASAPLGTFQSTYSATDDSEGPPGRFDFHVFGEIEFVNAPEPTTSALMILGLFMAGLDANKIKKWERIVELQPSN